MNYEIYDGKKLGELDLVCLKNNNLVFVEVKTRRDSNFMPIEEAVNLRKQHLLFRMAQLYLLNHPEHEEKDAQIDLVAIEMEPFDNSVLSAKIIENVIEEE